MLVDHADAAGDRVGRPGDGDRLAVEQDLARVGREQPVQDVHQRALAGAVLAEEGVDLAGPDEQVDAVVGDDAGEALGDAAHLEARGGRARATSGSIVMPPVARSAAAVGGAGLAAAVIEPSAGGVGSAGGTGGTSATGASRRATVSEG